MRLVSGKAGGINLDVPKGLDVRPTSIRARKALFDSLGQFAGRHVLDLFAGCGGLGLEAASRGAASVTLVEKNRRHCQFIEQNIEKVENAGVTCDFQVICRDVTFVDYSLIGKSVDYIFADPPYSISGNMFEALTQSDRFAELPRSATLIWEVPHDAKDKTKAFVSESHWQVINQRHFGGTDFLFLQQPQL